MSYYKLILLHLFLLTSVYQAHGLNPEKDYKHTTSDFGITISDSVYLQTPDGFSIFTYMFSPNTNDLNKTIIISYGDAGNLSFYFLYAKQLINYGYTVILFDYRGFGKSSYFEINKDQLFYPEFAQDLLTVVRYAKRSYPNHSTGIMAFSMGTIMTTLISDIEPIDFIIAENFVIDINQVKERLNKIALKPILSPIAFDNDSYLSKTKKIEVPLLIFSSNLDEITTLTDSYIFAKNDKCKIIPYQGAHGCGLLTLSDSYFREINNFLRDK